MGLRGPAPKPTALRLLEGNPGKRPINKNEPKPASPAPKPPSWLDKGAKREWRRVAPELERMGLLTGVDMAALAAYCQAFSRWEAAELYIAERGIVMIGAMGGPIQNPAVLIARQSMQLVKQFGDAFGLTPSARSRLSAAAADDSDDPFEAFLAGRSASEA